MRPWALFVVGLLLLTFATLGSGGMVCPDKCICDDIINLSYDCTNSGLEGIPIFFHPETKELKVIRNFIIYHRY